MTNKALTKPVSRKNFIVGVLIGAVFLVCASPVGQVIIGTRMIARFGGTYESDWFDNEGSLTFVDVSEQDFVSAGSWLGWLPELQCLYIRDSKVTADMIAALKNQPSIWSVVIQDSELAAGALFELQNLPNIIELGLNDCRLSPGILGELTPITAPKVLRLNLRGTPVEDSAMFDIATPIRELDLRATRITDSCVEALVRIDGLKELSVSETEVTGKGVSRLISRKPHLTRLDIQWTLVTESEWASIEAHRPSVLQIAYRKR